MVNKNLSSTEKALKILLAFTPNNPQLGTLDLSKQLEIHKSTVSRLLHLLTTHNFLQRDPATRKYMLGRAAAEIGQAVMRSLKTELVTIAQPYLRDLAEQIGESVALEVVSGRHIVLAYHVEGRRHIRFSFQQGEQVPVNVAAGAKAILAFSTPEFVDRCLQQRFEHYNDHTIVSKSKYRALLKEVRDSRVAYDHGERFEDTHAMATPIFNHEGQPIAAVVIAGPAFRLTAQFLSQALEPLKRTAGDISRRLFY